MRHDEGQQLYSIELTEPFRAACIALEMPFWEKLEGLARRRDFPEGVVMAKLVTVDELRKLVGAIEVLMLTAGLAGEVGAREDVQIQVSLIEDLSDLITSLAIAGELIPEPEGAWDEEEKPTVPRPPDAPYPYERACTALGVPWQDGMNQISERFAGLTPDEWGHPIDYVELDDLRTMVRTNEILMMTSFLAQMGGNGQIAREQLDAAELVRREVVRLAEAKKLIAWEAWE